MDLHLNERGAVVCASTSGLGEYVIARALGAERAHVVNGSEYRLTGVCINDLTAAYRFGAHARAGEIAVNSATAELGLKVAFDGVKHSSTNTIREQQPTPVDVYTWDKTVYLGHE
jgi:alpha-ketoglutaric semialdehyde dehydrogenase